MIQHIILGIIALFFISALFMAWYFYHQAQTKERLLLLKKGISAEEIFHMQQRRKITFTFPWLKLGIVVTSMSLAFLLIGLLVYWLEQDLELLKGFTITFILGFFLGLSFLVNHFIGHKKSPQNNDD